MSLAIEGEETPSALESLGSRPLLTRTGFAVMLTGAYLLAGIGAAAIHEPWRDEMQAWLLARDSESVLALFQHLRYEGTPGLWHLLLRGLSRISVSPRGMQALHLGIAAATVFLVARWSPFTRLQSVLFAFGYYSFYEYGAISRNYALAVLLSLLFCALLPRRRQNLLVLAAILFVLCQTCVHGVLIAFAATCWLILDCARDPSVPRATLFASLGTIACGAGLAVIQMWPPADGGFMAGWQTRFDLRRAEQVFGAVVRSYLPVPSIERHFWNTHLTEMLAGTTLIQVTLSLWILVAAVVLLTPASRTLAFFLVATLSLLLFSYVKHSAGYRHDGFLFLAFLMSLWIRQQSEPVPAGLLSLNRVMRPTLTGLLAVHVAGAAVALRYDVMFPFSCGPQAAAALLRDHPQRETVAFEPDYCGSSVLGHLPGIRGYFARGDRQGTFVIWDTRRMNEVEFAAPFPDALLIDRARANKVTLLVINRPMNSREVTLASRFVNSIVPDEQFYIYSLTPAPPQSRRSSAGN